ARWLMPGCFGRARILRAYKRKPAQEPEHDERGLHGAAESRKRSFQIFRPRSFKADSFARNGMVELQLPGMQERPLNPVINGPPLAGAVGAVADNGVTDRRAVHTQLVCPSCLRIEIHKRYLLILFRDLK